MPNRKPEKKEEPQPLPPVSGSVEERLATALAVGWPPAAELAAKHVEEALWARLWEC